MRERKVDVAFGLSQLEVNERLQQGKSNKCDDHQTKSYRRIFFDNIFTLFNFINVVLASLIILTGSFQNLLFLGVMFSNIAIGSFQEIRAKRVLDKISFIVNTSICVIREGKEIMIAVNDVVLDDIIKIKSGSQIVSDGILCEGQVEVDESLLSGESEVVIKKAGDFLYSGSFVVGNKGYYQVSKVGNDTYAYQTIKGAKKYSRYPSQLRDNLNKIIKYIGIMIIPLGIMLFMKQYFFLSIGFNESILSTSAALIGMIPEGLIILTSIALAVGSINLAKHKTLVQELYCLETLARVDVLCLDKTGTITEGKMILDNVIKVKEIDIDKIMKNLVYHLNDDNATFMAIKDYYDSENTMVVNKIIPFNSKKKYSGVIFNEETYLIGAYEFLGLSNNKKERECVESYAKQGYRIITLVQTKGNNENDLLEGSQVIAYFLLLDKIRDSAIDTFAYFKQQGVEIKVISGDHPITVAQIAKRAGLEGSDAFVDASTFTTIDQLEEAVKFYKIFGRVTPQQKKEMIIALKKQGHMVGMSGDGVNDVLAFKEANISVAMASGSDMAKASANLVLLDSNFDALPYVLYEGRRVINNVQRVATLFLTKTIFSCILVFFTLFVSFKYPFVPIHLTFVSTLTIGIPSFFLALEPNRNRVKKDFLENVMKISLPAAISVILCIVYIYISAWLHNYSALTISQLALCVISMNGMLVLMKVSRPYTKLRICLLIIIGVVLISGLGLGDFLLSFKPIHLKDVWIHLSVFMIMLLSISNIGTKIISFLYQKQAKHH